MGEWRPQGKTLAHCGLLVHLAPPEVRIKCSVQAGTGREYSAGAARDGGEKPQPSAGRRGAGPAVPRRTKI